MTQKNIMNMKMAELKEYAKELGLDTKGITKTDDMREAIGRYLAQVNSDASKYATNAMRPALVRAQRGGNAHAITANEALQAGVASGAFDEFKTWVQDLYDAVHTWYEHNVSRKLMTCSDEEFTAMINNDINRAYDAWRRVLRAGEENVFHPNMYVLPEDMPHFYGYMENTQAQCEELGSYEATNKPQAFRRLVERRIGLRMLNNGLIDAKDEEDLKTYIGAKKALASANIIIKGDEDKTSYPDRIAKAEKELEYKKKRLADKGITAPEDIANILDLDIAAIADLKQALESAERNKSQAEATIAALQNRVDGILKTKNIFDPDTDDGTIKKYTK